MAQKSWERMKGESSKAFEAFRIYRDMGEERSLRAVAQRLNKSLTAIANLSSAHQWVERARDYDNDLERAAHLEAVKGVREMQKRHLGMIAKMEHTAMLALQEADPKTMKFREQLDFLSRAMEMEQKLRVQIAEGTAVTAATEKDSAAGSSFADVIVAAYQRRQQDEPDN